MRRRRLPRALAGALAVTIAGFVVTASSTAGATTATVRFEYTGGPQAFTVPAGVTEVAVEACGAQGGSSASSADEGRLNSTGSHGGYGARALVTIPVTPGEPLQVKVGGNGDNGTAITAGGIPSATPARGGFNGGAGGHAATAVVGSGPSTRSAAAASGGGGGATDIRRGAFTLADRMLVAGGGGGGGSLGVRDGPTGWAFALSLDPPILSSWASLRTLWLGRDGVSGRGRAVDRAVSRFLAQPRRCVGAEAWLCPRVS